MPSAKKKKKKKNMTQKEYTSIKELALLRLDLQIKLFKPVKY